MKKTELEKQQKAILKASKKIKNSDGEYVYKGEKGLKAIALYANEHYGIKDVGVYENNAFWEPTKSKKKS